MVKLFYGSGSCTIDGQGIDIVGVHIFYRGAIEITNNNPDSFGIAANGDNIVIFPLMPEVSLSELFEYVGDFTITSAVVLDNNGNKVLKRIKRVMDYSELLDSKSEDMTVKSEELSASYAHGKKIAKTIVKQPYIANLNTATHKGTLFLEDGTEYNGLWHLHISDSSAMTGKTHTRDSKDLYYKQVDNKGEIIDKLVATKNPDHTMPITKLRRRGTSRGSTGSGRGRGGSRGGGGGGGY